MTFQGLFPWVGTYPNAEEYIAALNKLLQVGVSLDVKEIIAEGNDVAVLFERETKAPAAAKILVSVTSRSTEYSALYHNWGSACPTSSRDFRLESTLGQPSVIP